MQRQTSRMLIVIKLAMIMLLVKLVLYLISYFHLY